MPFKVIQSSSSVSIESQYATYFLIVIDSNRYPISYRFGVIAAFIVQILDTVITFEPPPPLEGGGLVRTTMFILGSFGKRVVDFLLVLIELFSLGVTAEALPAKIQSGPKMAQFFWYALTSSNINRFSQLFHCQNQEKICNNTITKDPTTPQDCRYTTL